MSSWREEGEEGEDEEEDTENDYKTAEDRIIFLIDARSHMFEKNKLGEVHFENCVKVALAVMKTKIVASDKSSIGIIFFGTEKNNSSSSSQGVYSLFSLDAPTASRIRELQEGMVENLSIFHKNIGSAPSATSGTPSYCPLNEAFWACSGAFSVKSQSHKQNDFRRIWLFTNDDNPNGNDPVDQERIIQASRDCSESGIELSLWHMNRADRAFDPQTFYTKLLTVGSSDSSEGGGDGTEDYIENRMRGAGYDGFDMMMENVRRKEHRKRKLGSHMFTLGGGEGGLGAGAAAEVQIALQMFKTVSITTRPSYAWLFRGTNEPLKSYSRMYDGQTGATLDDSRIETFVPLNESTRIPFTADDMAPIKQGRGSGVELLYFAPLSVLTPELNLSSPYFLFADEKRVQGSTALFAALISELSLRGLVAIVRFMRSAASMPRIAAMIPQMETLSAEGIQVLPMGMNLVQLPFNEEISLKHSEAPPGTEPGADAWGGADRQASDLAAVAMVQVLTIPTAPYQATGIAHSEGQGEGGGEKICYWRDMCNPSLQRFYSVLQAIALMEVLPSDSTQRGQDLLKPFFLLEPTQEGAGDGEAERSKSFAALVRKRAILKFKQAVALDDDAVALSECPKTKVRPSGAAGAAEKKARTGGYGAENVPEWKQMAAKDQLKNETVPSLKEMCQALGVPHTGLKKVLLDRVTQALAAL